MNQRMRILLVDNSPHFLEATKAFLNLHHPQAVIETATQAEAAIEKSRRFEPDLILLDLNLHGRSGLDLIGNFRKHLPQVRIILLSMMNGTAYLAASLRAGADEIVDKLTLNRTLLPAIRRQMGAAAGQSAEGLS